MSKFKAAIISVSVIIGIMVVVIFTVNFSPQAREDRAAVERGERLYSQNCLSCHGETGKGEGAFPGTALNNQHLLSTFSNEDIYRIIDKGKAEANMPSYSHLKSEEKEDLVSYIRNWQTKPLEFEVPSTIEGNRANGEKLYTAYCSTCHGNTGSGFNAAAPALGHPNTLELMTAQQLWISAAYGREETRMNSSLKGLGGVRQLEAQEISDIVAYIRYDLVKKYDPKESRHGH